jgi:hypothetical protein
MTEPKHVTVSIKPKTPQMEAYLQAGYPDMSVEKAKQIIKERRENPAMWPYEVLERAEAFLAAYESSPQVIATNPGWKRDRTT